MLKMIAKNGTWSVLSQVPIRSLSPFTVYGHTNIFPTSFSTSTISKTPVNLNGIIVAVPTPFNNDDKQSVNYEKLRYNVRKWEDIPLRGYCVGGTNGEWPHLKDDELLLLIRSVKTELSSDKVLIAGTSCESTQKTCELSQAAADAGANAVLVMVPHYFKTRITEKDIIDHFVTVADSVPVPVVIYNNPMTTGIDLSLKIIETLTTHTNIAGIKELDIVKMGCIVQKRRREQFSVLAGSAGYLLPALQMGCSGSLNGLSAVLGGDVHNIYALYRQKQMENAIAAQQKIILLDNLLLRNLGPPGLKAAMDLLGYNGGDCRRPLPQVSEKTKLEIKQMLQLKGFI